MIYPQKSFGFRLTNAFLPFTLVNGDEESQAHRTAPNQEKSIV